MNNFVWTDLSTFDVDKCKDFYRTIFGWEFHETTDQSMGGAYQIAHQVNTPVAAVFVMPEYLQKMDMPSFWMSYVRVDDIEKTVARARSHEGVIVEVEPIPFDEQSQIALIRDPSGAGFTVYQGPDLNGRFDDGHGRPVWNVHHLEHVDLVKEFYKDVFGWEVAETREPGVFDVVHASGEVIATMEEHPDDVRDGKSYWMPVFAGADMDALRSQIEALGGAYVHDISNGSMFADQQGGHFLVRKASMQKPVKSTASAAPRPILWKTIAALVLVLAALALDFGEFAFGLLFLWWTWHAIRTRSVFLVETVQRATHPVLYWSVVGLYFVLSVYSITTVFFEYRIFEINWRATSTR